MAAVVVGASFLAGCAEIADPETDEVATETGDHDGGPSAPTEPMREFSGAFSFSAPDCERPTVAFSASAFYVDDGSRVPDISCRIEFDDNSVFDECEGTHTFETGGVHFATHSIRDNAGGFVDAQTEPSGFFVDESPQLTVQAEAPACGLEFSWRPEIVGDIDGAVSFIEPAENVVDDSMPTRVIVSEPGTYTVTFVAEQERVGPICEYRASTTVEVFACPDDHEHTPDCPH